jgi:hypothetical protein
VALANLLALPYFGALGGLADRSGVSRQSFSLPNAVMLRAQLCMSEALPTRLELVAEFALAGSFQLNPLIRPN